VHADQHADGLVGPAVVVAEILGELGFVDQRQRFLVVVVAPRALEPRTLLGAKLVLCSKYRSLRRVGRNTSLT
jgi:hypothetical protein